MGKKAMFGQPGAPRRRIQELVARFRDKGATSPEKAMTAQELGLPPRFEGAMKGRLGRTGIFIEADGKYYLDEARLQRIEEERGSRSAEGPGYWNADRRAWIEMRIARMVVGVSAIILFLFNVLLVESVYLRIVALALAVLWIVLTLFQLFYMGRSVRRWRSQGPSEDPGAS